MTPGGFEAWFVSAPDYRRAYAVSVLTRLDCFVAGLRCLNDERPFVATWYYLGSAVRP